MKLWAPDATINILTEGAEEPRNRKHLGPCWLVPPAEGSAGSWALSVEADQLACLNVLVRGSSKKNQSKELCLVPSGLKSSVWLLLQILRVPGQQPGGTSPGVPGWRQEPAEEGRSISRSCGSR